MTLETLIATHGYWIVLVGTVIEGETILILGGIAAHSGSLSLPLVMLAAFAGSMLGDQTMFFLGRRHGPSILARRPAWQARMQRADTLLARYDVALLIGFRFLIGLRMATPFAIGMSPAISTGRFVFFNALGAALWAIAVGWVGYGMGEAAEELFGKARRYEVVAFVVVCVVAGLIGLVDLIRRRRA